MRTTQRTKLFILTATLTVAGTGCMDSAGVPIQGEGWQPYWNTSITGAQHPATSFGDDELDDESEGEDTDSGTGVNINGDSTSGADVEPLEFPVKGKGYDVDVTVRVTTNKILKVRFRPDPQQGVVKGTGFSPSYTGLGVYLTVGSVTKATPLLYNGANGGSAQVSSPMSFAGAYTNKCASTDTACRVSVTIHVTKPNYDHYCLNYPDGFPQAGTWVYPCAYPGYTHVHENHPWYGTLLVYTDDTGNPK